MKKLVVLALCFMILSGGYTVFAQKELKIAHLNYSDLVMSLPETDSIKNVLQDEEKKVEGQLVKMEEELNKAVLEYQKAEKDTNEYLMEVLYKQVLEIQGRIEEFRKTSLEKLQAKSMELMNPVYKKVESAINEVAKQNKITYVLDTSNGMVLFTAEDSQDIIELVKERLRK